MGNTTQRQHMTAHDLYMCVPVYQDGVHAEEALTSNSAATINDVHSLETRVRAKNVALRKIVHQLHPLIVHEVNKLLDNSMLNKTDVFNVVYYSGVSGLERGLLKFDAAKMDQSSTNYIVQWVASYAKRELLSLEAPLGVPPSRYEKHKKIAAVRRRISEQWNRDVTNEELFTVFQQGGADMRGMKGRVSNKGQPSQANRDITLALIEEQEQLERHMYVDLLDPKEDYASSVKMSQHDSVIFAETLFGVFLNAYPFSNDAKAVLQSELQYPEDDGRAQCISVSDMSERHYRHIANLWKKYLSDPTTEFYQFLVSVDPDDFPSIDVRQTRAHIESLTPTSQSRDYSLLFENNDIS